MSEIPKLPDDEVKEGAASLNELELQILMDWMSTPVTAGFTFAALEKHGKKGVRVNPASIYQLAEYHK